MYKLLSYLLDMFIKLGYFITASKLPHFVSVTTYVTHGDKILIQNRSDDKGFCMPGGLTKAGERVEDAAKRELQEETGIITQDLDFLFYSQNEQKKPIMIVLVFHVKTYSGKIKDSWEGKVSWEKFDDIKGKMAFDQEKIIEKIWELSLKQ